MCSFEHHIRTAGATPVVSTCGEPPPRRRLCGGDSAVAAVLRKATSERERRSEFSSGWRRDPGLLARQRAAGEGAVGAVVAKDVVDAREGVGAVPRDDAVFVATDHGCV